MGQLYRDYRTESDERTLSLLKKLDATSAKAFEKILDQIESGECRIVIDLDKFSGIIYEEKVVGIHGA